jgi:hypothetical protein
MRPVGRADDPGEFMVDVAPEQLPHRGAVGQRTYCCDWTSDEGFPWTTINTKIPASG